MNNRSFPKEALDKIKKERLVRTTLEKKDKKDFVKELEEQLENAKVELIYWFNKIHTLESDTLQLKIKVVRTKDALDSTRYALKAEQEKSTRIQNELDNLKILIGNEK